MGGENPLSPLVALTSASFSLAGLPSHCPTPPIGQRAAAKGRDCGRKRSTPPWHIVMATPSPIHLPTALLGWQQEGDSVKFEPVCPSAQNLFPFLTHTCTHELTPHAHTHIFSHTLDFSTRIFSRPRLSPDPHGRNPSGPRVATTKLQTIWKAKRKTSRGTAARRRCRQLGSGEGREKPG